MLALFILALLYVGINSPREPKRCQTFKDIFETAKYLYSQQNFTESYRLFHELYKNNINATPLCAWYQIQCLIELRHWNLAIQAIQHQIRKEPHISEWYLLASEVYMDYLSNFFLAWKTLSMVPEDDCPEIQLRKRIAYEGYQMMLNRQPKKVENKRSDFVGILPYEVVHTIFRQLDFKSLIVTTAVSTRWRRFLINDPYFWRDLEFSEYNLNKTYFDIDPFINLCLERLPDSNLRRLTLFNQYIGYNHLSLTLSKKQCKNLEELVLCDVECIPSLFFNTLIYPGTTSLRSKRKSAAIRVHEIFFVLIKNSPYIKRLTIRNCFRSSYDVLLQNEAITNSAILESIIGEPFFTPLVPRLTTNLSRLEDLELLELSDIQGINSNHLESFLINCPKLQRLVLYNCMVDFLDTLIIVRTHCPNLQQLTYEPHQDSQQPSITLQDLTQSDIDHTNRKPWIELKINRVDTLSDPVLRHLLVESKKTIEHLDLRGCPMITDLALLDREPMQNLKSVCLRECSGITKRGLNFLIAQNPFLEYIDLSHLAILDDDLLKQLLHSQCIKTLNFSHSTLNFSDGLFEEFINNSKDTLTCIDLDQSSISKKQLCYYIRKIKGKV